MTNIVHLLFHSFCHYFQAILDLSRNSLNGEIPSELGMCTSLKSLYLYRNKLTGSLPNELQNLVMLDRAGFNENVQLMGNLSDDIVFLSNLKELNIRSTEITIDCMLACKATNSGIKIIRSSPGCSCG
jgi:Leucine-rich repeat (LRR) protein